MATTLKDAQRLKEGYEASGNRKVIVSFPLRVTSLVQLVKEVVDSGKIGTVEHVQAINNVPYGSAATACLNKNFIELMRGDAQSVSTLDDGLQSALLCLKAKQSALTGTSQQVSWN